MQSQLPVCGGFTNLETNNSSASEAWACCIKGPAQKPLEVLPNPRKPSPLLHLEQAPECIRMVLSENLGKLT